MLYRLRPLARRGQRFVIHKSLFSRSFRTGIIVAARPPTRPPAPAGQEYVYTEEEIARQEKAGRIWNDALLEPRETRASWREFETRMVGLEVVPNAREVLISLYENTIQKAELYGSMLDKKDNAYNEHVIRLCKSRLEVVQSTDDVATIEKIINNGLIEEVITQAEDELNLLVEMNEVYKPWEPSPEGEEEARGWPLEFGATEEDYEQWEGKDLDDLDELMKHVTEKAGQIRFGMYGQENAENQAEQITK